MHDDVTNVDFTSFKKKCDGQTDKPRRPKILEDAQRRLKARDGLIQCGAVIISS